MTKEILNSIISTMDFNVLFELAESHLCGLYIIKNKDRNLLRKEYGLKEDLENESEENLIKAISKMNAKIIKNK